MVANLKMQDLIYRCRSEGSGRLHLVLKIGILMKTIAHLVKHFESTLIELSDSASVILKKDLKLKITTNQLLQFKVKARKEEAEKLKFAQTIHEIGTQRDEALIFIDMLNK